MPVTPPTIGGRPTPPGGTRPTPPGGDRPTPPGGTRPPSIGTPDLGQDAMRWVTRQVDRDRNGTIESSEGRVVGQVGNRNGVNGVGETAEALDQGKAAIYGFQLAGDLAETLANWFSKGDAWVSQEDTEITGAAKARLDGNRDGRVSRAELAEGLSRGGLAINARGIMTSDEARSRFETSVRPPSIDPVRPPSIGPRPPSIDPVRPPSIDPIRPPSIGTSLQPGEILNDFMRRHNELKSVYNTTSMSSTTYNETARRMASEAVDALVNRTGDAPFATRKAALDAIYNASPMSSTEHGQAMTRLWQQAAQELVARRLPYGQAKVQLDALYNASNMSSTQRGELDRQLISQEVSDIMRSRESFTVRMARLQALYNGSSMSSTEFRQLSDELTRQAF